MTAKELDAYFEKALAAIPKTHPHRQEIIDLLLEQVGEEMRDLAAL